MSASREKKGRQAPASAASEQAAKSAKSRLIGILVAVVVFLLIAAIVFVKGPFLKKMSTAVTVGDHKLNPVMVRYYYSENFNSFLSNYSSLANYMFESTDHIEKQIFDEENGKTWGDYFMDLAIDQMKVTYSVYDEAISKGYTLSEEDEQSITSTFEAIKTYAKYYGVTENAYIQSIYGPASDVKSLNEYLHVNAIANGYQNMIKDSFSYSESELNELYDSAPSAYNSYSYHSYYISGTAAEGEDAEAKMAEAAEKADSILSAVEAADDETAKLDQYLIQISILSGNDGYLDGQMTLHSNKLGSSLDACYHDWVVSEDREAGDVEKFSYNDSGYYVIYYVGTSSNDYATVNARIIPINVTSDDEEGWQNALEQKEALQKDLDATDDRSDEFFSNLAYAYSDDEATMYTGGLYEGISKSDEFSDAILAWLFADGRQAGDSEILLTASGYCFVYYVSEGESYRDTLLDAELRSADFSLWYDSATNVEEPVRNEAGMKRVVMDLSYSAS